MLSYVSNVITEDTIPLISHPTGIAIGQDARWNVSIDLTG
jgi:hypothetical protein